MESFDPKILVAAVVVVITIIYFAFGGSAKPPTPFLVQNRRERLKVPLKERIQISHDTVRLRFGLPTEDTILGLPVGNHFKIFCPNAKGCKVGEWNGRQDAEDDDEIERKYTPTSLDSQRGSFDLVIKVYKGGALPQFPDGGKMSQFMDGLKVGETIDISGPWGMIEYVKPGVFTHGRRELNKKHIGMMAGGTGITPMLQIITSILSNPNDTTKLSLLYANKTEEDILLRETLDQLASTHNGRFKVWYTLDNPPACWKFSKGFITAEMISEHLPSPSDETVVLMCGPPPMVKFACQENLNKLGFKKEDQLAF